MVAMRPWITAAQMNLLDHLVALTGLFVSGTCVAYFCSYLDIFFFTCESLVG